MQLYPFQERGLNEAREWYRRGKRAGLLVGPTGMGKTVVFSAAAHGRIQRGGRVVVVAHRRELVEQAANKIAALGLEVGWAGRKSNALVQVTSIQTILAKRTMPKADFAIFDEAHHYAADEWSLAPRAYLSAGARLLGVTATPERDDGRGLGGDDGVFDFLVTVAQVSELVALNALEPDKGVTPIELVGPRSYVRGIAADPVDAYEAHTPGRHAVVFAPHVKQALVYSEQFAARGIEAPVVTGDTETEERDRSLARFANGDVRILVNVNVLTEGWDAPICDVCILGRKIGSLSLYYQCIGRARRARIGKTMAYLIDLSGNYELHGHPDEDLVYSLDGDCAMGRAGAAGAPGPRVCRNCRRVLDDDIRAAWLAGTPLERCPEPGCGTPISKIRVMTAEDVALEKIVRDDERRTTTIDVRVKALATMYQRNMGDRKSKDSAHYAYKNMFKSGFPPSEVRAQAWRLAVERTAAIRGDAWHPDEDPPGRVDDNDPEVETIL